MLFNFNPEKHKFFTPKYPDKYVGKNVNKIVCRSSWEFKFCNWLDLNVNVMEWASECLKIPYYDPIKRKKRNYIPDFFMSIRNKNNELERFIIEIKPHNQSVKPRNSKNKTQARLIEENAIFLNNQAKWNSAKAYCEKYGLKFKVLTEKELFK